jgi:hypothetical protein
MAHPRSVRNHPRESYERGDTTQGAACEWGAARDEHMHEGAWQSRGTPPPPPLSPAQLTNSRASRRHIISARHGRMQARCSPGRRGGGGAGRGMLSPSLGVGCAVWHRNQSWPRAPSVRALADVASQDRGKHPPFGSGEHSFPLSFRILVKTLPWTAPSPGGIERLGAQNRARPPCAPGGCPEAPVYLRGTPGGAPALQGNHRGPKTKGAHA